MWNFYIPYTGMLLWKVETFENTNHDDQDKMNGN